MDVFLFSHDPAYAGAAIAAGIAGIVVDWEARGKAERQRGRDTEINQAGAEQLRAIVAVARDRAACRINNDADGRTRECELALELGAVEILLPMVRRIAEVEELLRRIDGRARLSVLAETREAMQLARELDDLPLARVFVGLHDYRIDNRHDELFEPLVDGTMDRFRERYRGAFGVAGITHPESGSPVPQRLLLAAMVRLGCTFGIARRSFRADVPVETLAAAIAAIDRVWSELGARDRAQIEADHAALSDRIRADATSMPVPALAGL
jgi:hypothetical protein